VPLSWTSVTDNADAAPDLIIAFYTSAQAGITAAAVIAGTGTGFVSKATVADAKLTVAYAYGSGGLTEAALASGTSYFVYAVARDAAGNTGAVLAATASTASPTWIPASSNFEYDYSTYPYLTSSVFKVSPTGVACLILRDIYNKYARLLRRNPTTNAWDNLGLPTTETENAHDMCIDANGNVMVIIWTTTQSYVDKWSSYRYNATTATWTYRELTDLKNNYFAVINSPSGVPHLVYMNKTNFMTVKKYNLGTNDWDAVGTLNVTFFPQMAPRIKLDAAGNIYTTFSTATYVMSCYKFTAATSTWGLLGTNGFAAYTSFSHALAVDTLGVPYVTYCDARTSGKTSVVRFIASAWEYVGGAGISELQTSQQDIVCDSSGGVVICYRDSTASLAGTYRATAKKYDPVTNTWVLLGQRMFSTAAAAVQLQYSASDKIFYCLIRESLNNNLSLWKLSA
jgi:hypothetical protein